MRDYERRVAAAGHRTSVSLGSDGWSGFAVAAPGEAAGLLAGGWPPARATLVPGVRLFRYTDPSEHERRELVPYIARSAHLVVDVGCGSGLFGGILRAAGRRVVGIEPDWELARCARARVDVVLPVPGDLGLQAIRTPVDCVVLADVLEHAFPPGRLLRAAARAVKPDREGSVVVSFPNAAWAPVVRALAAGRWDVTLAGVQARDHVFYTTPQSFTSLARECGLAVERLEPLGPDPTWRERLRGFLLARTTGGRASELAAAQWVAVLRTR